MFGRNMQEMKMSKESMKPHKAKDNVRYDEVKERKKNHRRILTCPKSSAICCY